MERSCIEGLSRLCRWVDTNLKNNSSGVVSSVASYITFITNLDVNPHHETNILSTTAIPDVRRRWYEKRQVIEQSQETGDVR